MPNNNKSFGSRGLWDNNALAKLKGVELPARLACKECKRQKPVGQFSKKQLGDLQQHLYRHNRRNAPGAGDHIIRCRTCTPGVNTELHCMVCGETKALDCFSKTHRSHPDTARCIRCIDEHMRNNDPGLENYNGDDSDDSEVSNPYASTIGDTASYIGNDDDENESVAGGVQLPLTSNNLQKSQLGQSSRLSSTTRQSLPVDALASSFAASRLRDVEEEDSRTSEYGADSVSNTPTAAGTRLEGPSKAAASYASTIDDAASTTAPESEAVWVTQNRAAKYSKESWASFQPRGSSPFISSPGNSIIAGPRKEKNSAFAKVQKLPEPRDKTVEILKSKGKNVQQHQGSDDEEYAMVL
ncbi:hypothetical protein MMC25_002773 [Agyrium rufum]|nr:hypothetical protein [Agyrium rufum]